MNNVQHTIPEKFKHIDYTTGMKTRHSLKNCFKGEFEKIIVPLARQKILFEIPSLKLRMESDPIEEWKISATIYRQYSCLAYAYCSRCCMFRFWKLFTYKPEGNYETIETFLNGERMLYYCQENIDGKCQYMTDNNVCSIHERNPIHCMMPLVTFRRYAKYPYITHIQKRVYGENHHIACPVEFRPYTDFKDFEADTITRFKRLKDYLDNDLGVSNYVGDVIRELKNRGEAVINGVNN